MQQRFYTTKTQSGHVPRILSGECSLKMSSYERDQERLYAD